MPSLKDNLCWDTYSWPLDGDEWTDQASFSGVPYPVWKQDVVDTFITPNLSKRSAVLEIGVGRGRWTPYLAKGTTYMGVDLSSSCITYCRRKYHNLPKCKFLATDGESLTSVCDDSIDFIWSFDTFVHIEADTTFLYLQEIARALAASGSACLHHPGHPNESQRRRGWRSAVTMDSFAAMAHTCGLKVLSQTDTWGPNNRSNTRLAGDCLSTLVKPHSE